MIVEDENGRDIDLGELDDDREPGEPPEDDQPPFDVEVARAAWEASRDEPMRTGPGVRDVLEAFPAALDEVEQLRRELAYWRSLP